jgi:hypothetical protein
LRADNGCALAAAQAVMEVTPGTISVSKSSDSRAKRYMKEP